MVGYAETFSGGTLYSSGPPWYFSTNINVTLSPKPIAVGPTTIPVHVSSRVLLACATITMPGNVSTNYATLKKYRWNQLPHTLDPDVPVNKPFTSSHMVNGALASGGNLTMLDGHVEWKPLQQMIPRAGSAAGGGFGPNFYW